MRRIFVLIAALSTGLFAVLCAAALVPSQKAVTIALAELAEVSGFTVRRPLAFESITRSQVNQFLQERIGKSVKPEEIRAEELTLKKFGFVPQDFDLKKSTLDLLTEQTAAFYDFHRKKLYITDWAATSLQDEVLVHELAHALADQNFSLEKYSDKVEYDSEKSLARQAVVEGQASWLAHVILRRHGVNPTPDSKEPPPDDEKFPVFEKAPLYFKETLMFPYNQGEAFQKAVFEKYGKEGYTRVYKNPPVSSQQIIHPELYFSGQIPLDPDVPEIKGMKRLVEGPIGELDIAILLQQYLNPETAQEVSPHWRGGHYRIYENKKDKRDVLVHRSVWDSDGRAEDFFAMYQQIMKGKWKKMEITSRSEFRIDGTGDDGYFCVEQSATTVTSREGLAAPCPK